MSTFLSSREAARALGVSLPTLYAYVSRGLLHSEPAAEGSRARRYRRSEVDALLQAKRSKLDPQESARGALNWGAPVLDSAITSITDGHCFYRGRAIEELVHCSFEEVAEWLWRGQEEPGTSEAHSPGNWRLSPACRDSLTAVRASAPVWREAVDLLQVALPVAALEDLEAVDLSQDSVAQCGSRILGLMAATIAHSSLEGRALPSATSIAQLLQRSWAPSRPELAELINRALVVSADHELNVSTFTARCVASASSTPYEVVSAGLAALRGRKHGGHSERVEALLQELSSPHRPRSELRAALARRLKRGAEVPGFGHALYPEGDPRCRLLLDALSSAAADNPTVTSILALIEEGSSLTGEQPTLDVGLAAISTAYSLPTGSALALFALGRSAGWLAHAVEQYEVDRLIRPRARYVGEPPSR